MASVAAQDFLDYEHIVVDGASTDDTLSIATTRATGRTIILSEPDTGLYDAMNKGLHRARGDYVSFLNADDFLVRTDVFARVAAAAATNPAAISGGAVIVREREPRRWTRSYGARSFSPWMLRFGHMPPHPGFHVRRDIALTLGGFDTSLRMSADFDFLVRFYGCRLSPVLLAETLVAVREGGASNRGFESRRTIAREALASLRKNGVKSNALFMWLKYLAKSAQLVVPPAAFPPPPGLAWFPATP